MPKPIGHLTKSKKYDWKRLQAGFLYGRRISLGLSIRAAAKLCGVHWTTFEKAENGHSVSNTVARKIGMAMGLTEKQSLQLVMGFAPNDKDE